MLLTGCLGTLLFLLDATDLVFRVATRNYATDLVFYHITTPELISAATVVRSATSFACGLRPHAKPNPRTPLTPAFLTQTPNLRSAVP